MASLIKVALALARLGRLDDAALVVAICEGVHAELSWRPPPPLVDALAEAREIAGEARVAAHRRRAVTLGVRGGLDHVRALAVGEPG